MIESLVDILCEWCLVEDAEGEDGLRRVEQVIDGDEGRLLEEGLRKQIWCQTVSDSVVAKITSKTQGGPCGGSVDHYSRTTWTTLYRDARKVGPRLFEIGCKSCIRKAQFLTLVSHNLGPTL